MEILNEILSKIHFTEEINFDITNEKFIGLDIHNIELYEMHDVSHRRFIENYRYRKRSDGDNYVSLDIKIKNSSSQTVLSIIQDILLKFNKEKINISVFEYVKENQLIHSFNLNQNTRIDLIKVNESLSIQVVRHDGSHFNNENV